jgi:hypothetical protein
MMGSRWQFILAILWIVVFAAISTADENPERTGPSLIAAHSNIVNDDDVVLVPLRAFGKDTCLILLKPNRVLDFVLSESRYPHSINRRELPQILRRPAMVKFEQPTGQATRQHVEARTGNDVQSKSETTTNSSMRFAQITEPHVHSMLPIEVDSLVKLPYIHSVTATPTKSCQQRIVHILNMHYVTQSMWFWGRPQEELDKLSEADRKWEYESVLARIEAVQEEQQQLLSAMIRSHHIRAIYAEGLSPESRRLLSMLKSGTEDVLRPARKQFERQFGALGRLFLNGELKNILPAENLNLQVAAIPFRADGSYHFDPETHEKREDAMIKCIMDRGDKDAVIVLGGGHDLTNNIQRLGKSCQYIRVVTKKFWEFSEKVQTLEPAVAAEEKNSVR